MYYLFFIIYLAAGFALVLWALLWAIKNGQFRDQQRARYLALHEERGKPPLHVKRFNRYQAYGLFSLMLCGLLAGAAFVFYVLVGKG